ncbi:hypothetical protein [Paenibacillus hamazuiensis]|uniref:hypothetical protein n=1 Tax=Paenibacillus hamazuiensis TaxID=2936508 RepID=UPI00200F364F|nr:hypothetical protein [Paenibacillus hamazuiensis]
MNRPKLRLFSRLAVKAAVLCAAFAQIAISVPAQAGMANQANAASADRPSYSATWIWDTSSRLKNADGAIQYFRDNGFNLVFMQIDPDVPKESYKTFNKKAAASGIEVHALGGAPDWILREKQIKVYQLIDWVKIYNQSAAAEEQFKGIHLDVEPYVMKAWHADTDTMLGLWRDTVSGFVEEMKLETPQLVAGADLPVWLEMFDVPDGQGERTTLSNWMIRKLDQTTLMAYRDNVPDIISSITTELKEAERNGKPVIVAVETLPSEDLSISYFHKTKAQLTSDLGEVEKQLGGSASYAGYAIHDADGWTGLKE